MDRYFFFTYYVSDGIRESHGNLFFKHDGFPSNAFIKEAATKNCGLKDPIVLGWKEFESEEDYKAFKGEE